MEKSTIKIDIRKFGPIRNKTVEFAPFVILTGDSNLGKSYVNYLFHYFIFSIVEKMSDLIAKYGEKEQIELSLKDISDWLGQNVQQYMRDFLGDSNLECEVNFNMMLTDDSHSSKYHIDSDLIDFDTDATKDVRKVLEVRINGQPMDRALLQSSVGYKQIRSFLFAHSLSRYVQLQLFGKSFQEVIILPPSRGALVGESFSIKDSVASSMGMYQRFLSIMDKIVRVRPEIVETKDDIKYQVSKLVAGELVAEKNEQYFVLKNGHRLPLRAAASSIKELSPLLFALQNTNSNNLSFCVEEPEAHLHPRMQIGVMDLIAACYNKGMFFQVTTHSDYFMQRFNQLVKLRALKDKSVQSYQKIGDEYHIAENLLLKTDGIKAYYFQMGKDNEVDIQELSITEQGMNMVTFFDVVEDIQNVEDEINTALLD